MVDSNIVGCNWIELPAGTYFIRGRSSTGDCPAKTSHCQIEVDVACDKLISHEPEGTKNESFHLPMSQLNKLKGPLDTFAVMLHWRI